MKILYVLGTVQHPTIMRGALRHYHFLRELAGRHSITLLTMMEGEVPPKAMDELEALTERLIIIRIETSSTRAPGSHTGTVHRLDRKVRLHRAVRAMGRAFREIRNGQAHDVLLFHGKRAYPAIAGSNGIPTVIDFCDATSLRHRERLRHSKLARVPWRLAGYASARRTERRLVRHTPHLAFISMRDRDVVMGGGSGARVLPNGIDLHYWTRRGDRVGHGANGANGAIDSNGSDGATGRAAKGGSALAENGESLVFTGVMDYAPNEDAAVELIQNILPEVRRARPGTKLVIAGRDPTAGLVDLAARVPDVVVTGFVEDLRPYLEAASVYVAPIRYASGLQNKILEALAMRVPVVTTPVVAEGLRINGAVEPPVRVARRAAPLAEAVLSLLEDPAQRRGMADAGRRYVEAHFNWARGAAALEEMCRQAESVSHSGNRAHGGAGGRP